MKKLVFFLFLVLSTLLPFSSAAADADYYDYFCVHGDFNLDGLNNEYAIIRCIGSLDISSESVPKFFMIKEGNKTIFCDEMSFTSNGIKKFSTFGIGGYLWIKAADSPREIEKIKKSQSFFYVAIPKYPIIMVQPSRHSGYYGYQYNPETKKYRLVCEFD